jgi:hypothetical protein
MEELMDLRTFAAVTTVLTAALVAAIWNARITVAGIVIFIVASLAWLADGWRESKASSVQCVAKGEQRPPVISTLAAPDIIRERFFWWQSPSTRRPQTPSSFIRARAWRTRSSLSPAPARLE